jgi:hypothetical protein
MNLSEAKMILGVDGNDLEEVKDSYEESVFNQVQIFLKDPFIPNLVPPRLKKIQDAHEAYIFFNKKTDYPEYIFPELIPLSKILNWREFWIAYEKNKSNIRKSIVECYEFSNLEKLLSLMNLNENEYAERLVTLLPQVKPDPDVKLSEAVPVVELLKECESLRDKNGINDTIGSISGIPENMITFNLSKEVNRLRKILKNG